MNKLSGNFKTISYKDGKVIMLDQRILPHHEEYNEYSTVDEVVEAIKTMVIRGAPAIGVAAAYGMSLASQGDFASNEALLTHLEEQAENIRMARPTAVNLFWAVDRMIQIARLHQNSDVQTIQSALAQEASTIHKEDIECCVALGNHGAKLVPDEAVVLTHCNAGALATAGYGTALGVIRSAVAAGKNVKVFADETRPFLQGARLTAWELAKDEIDVTVISDVAAASIIASQEVDCIVVGADRIAANGDTANKVGTYGLALAAHANDVPFYIAAPWSTIDPECPSGKEIPIEERPAREVTHVGDVQIVPNGVSVRNPAFDVTPHHLISAIITERGIYTGPYDFTSGAE